VSDRHVATCYAIYGLIIFWGEFGTLFWFHEESFKLDLRSTFVNRNSYATYAGRPLLLCFFALAGWRLSACVAPFGAGATGCTRQRPFPPRCWWAFTHSLISACKCRVS
jgi:hypothetical protein